MADNFKTAMSKTALYFESLCVPILKNIMNYEFMSVEGFSADEHKKLLDIKAGIDIWAFNNNGIRGIASRIQTGNAWNTFTIRYSRESGGQTEYVKRDYAIQNDYLYPYYTMQAYIKDNEVLSLAICKTKALYEKIKNNKCKMRKTGEDQIGQSIFIIVDWCCFSENEIRIYKKENL